MDIPRETLKLLVGLAEERWKGLRREHNRHFMAYGPGQEWERWKTHRSHEYREIEVLQSFINEANVDLKSRMECN